MKSSGPPPQPTSTNHENLTPHQIAASVALARAILRALLIASMAGAPGAPPLPHTINPPAALPQRPTNATTSNNRTHPRPPQPNPTATRLPHLPVQHQQPRARILIDRSIRVIGHDNVVTTVVPSPAAVSESMIAAAAVWAGADVGVRMDVSLAGNRNVLRVLPTAEVGGRAQAHDMPAAPAADNGTGRKRKAADEAEYGPAAKREQV